MNKKQLRKTLLKIHLYGGVFAVGYFLVFATSAIRLHHQPGFLQPNNIEEEWKEKLVTTKGNDESELIAELKDSMNVFGYELWWKRKTNNKGQIAFDIENPGKNYTIIYNKETELAMIKTRHKGFFHTLHALHFYTETIDGAKVNVWPVYSYICTIYLLFAIISGLWLWVASKRERLISWIVLSGIGIGSGIMLIYMYLI